MSYQDVRFTAGYNLKRKELRESLLKRISEVPLDNGNEFSRCANKIRIELLHELLEELE